MVKRKINTKSRGHTCGLLCFFFLSQNETALMTLFSEFLRQINQVYKSRSPEGKKCFKWNGCSVLKQNGLDWYVN